MNLSIPERKALYSSAFGLSLLGAAGMFMGYDNPFAHIPPLALLAPACLAMLGILLPTYKNTFYFAWLCSGLGQSACLYWLTVPMHDFGGLPWLLTLPCLLALGAFLGLYGVLFALGIRLFQRYLPGLGVALLAGPLWAGLEMAKGWIFTGFPWVSLSTSFVPWPIWIQAAAVVGAYGLSGIYATAAVFLVQAAPIRFIRAYSFEPVSRKQRMIAFGCAIIPITALYAYGLYALSTPLPQEARAGSIRVALVQGNINQDQKWEPRYQRQTLDRYLTLSEKAVNPELGAVTQAVDMVIWPETSMPFYFEDNQTLASILTAFAERFNVTVAFGAPGKGIAQDGSISYHNRLWLFNPRAFSLQSYDKEHLVPFGEYIPLNLSLGFIDYFVQGLDFVPGRSGMPLRQGKLALGGLICYEAIFPEMAQQRVEDGTNLFINISNDAWFGRTAAPVQHLHLTSMRAVEQGRYIVRSTNTGISAIIDNYGITRIRGSWFRAEVVIGEATLLTHTTLYHSVSAYITTACLLLPLCAVIFCFCRFRKTKNNT